MKIGALAYLSLLSLFASRVLPAQMSAATFPQARSGPLHLRFIDAATGYAVRPQQVTLNTKNAVGATHTVEVDEKGKATTPALATGRTTLVAVTAGYKPVSLAAEAFDSTQVYNIYLTPLHPPDNLSVRHIRSLHQADSMLFAGYIVDEESGRPLREVTVSATPSQTSVVTDEAGFFTLVVPVPLTGAGGSTQKTELLFHKAGFRDEHLLNVESWQGGEWVLHIRLVEGSGENVRDEAAQRFREKDGPETTAEHVQGNLVPLFQASLERNLPLQPGSPEDMVQKSQAFTVRVPQYIRVKTDSGVDVLPFDFQCSGCESYIADVLPAEWPPFFGDLNSGGMNALLAGAVAVRTYGAYFVSHPLRSSYDICGTTVCQQFTSHNNSPHTDVAAQQTAGIVLTTVSGAIAFSEFSKENNNHGCGDGYTGTNTADNPCIYDPVCAGVVPNYNNTHGRGMCQDGSGRWATGFYNLYSQPHQQNGQPSQTWDWILGHYYPHFAITAGRPLMVGDRVQVFGSGSSGLGVHRCADGGISGGVSCPRLTNEPDGSMGMIVGGSRVISADGYNYTWWQVQWDAPNQTGWSAENWLALASGSHQNGTIQVKATLDGSPWPATQSAGVLNWRLGGTDSKSGGTVPFTLNNETPGGYTITYLSGGPTGFPPSITPPASQNLSSGGTITFTFNFASSCRQTGAMAGASCGPPPTCYVLTLARNNTSGGSLPTASPANSSVCGAGQYLSGENIQLTAYPANGYGVGSWSGTGNDASTSTTNSLVMPASNRTVAVNYVQISQNGQPAVTTENFDQVTATGANLHGWVNPNGHGTNVYFAYGTDVVHSPRYTGQQYVGMGTTTIPFSMVLANLTCATTYTYYAVGSNSAGTGIGQIQAFTTDSCPTSSAPTITSEWVDGIAQTSAVLYALVNPNGLPTTGNFQYGTNPGAPNTTPPQPMGSATSDVELGWAIDGLSCGTTYSYNVVVSNSAGPSAGPWQTFRTLDCSNSRPSVANESVDVITQTSAALHAVVTPNGGNLAYGFFYYGTTAAYGNATPLQPVGSGWDPLTFTQSVSGLACGTTYHYQITGQNSAGPTGGTDQTFRTADCGGQPLGNGTVVVQATLDGVPWSGNVAYSVVGGPGYFYGSTVPAVFPVSIVGIGLYGIQDIFGGPASLAAVTPGFPLLADGSTLTFTLQFSSRSNSQTGAIIVDATLDGNPWTGPFNYTIYGPHSFDGSGEYTYTNVPAGAYGIVLDSGGPTGVPLAAVSPSGSDMTLIPGGALTFTFVFQTSQHMGILYTQATLNGSPWSGNITFQVSGGPTGSFIHVFAPEVFVEPPGIYNVQYLSGGPVGALFRGITPSSSQAVDVSRMTTFSFDFVDPSAGTSFYTLTPCRLVDTRKPSDGPAITTNEGRTLIFVGKCGIPVTATAVSLNVTIVNPTADGYLSLYPDLGVPPSTATITFRQGQVRANNAIVILNGFGGMTVFGGLGSLGAVDYVIDVNGYFQ